MKMKGEKMSVTKITRIMILIGNDDVNLTFRAILTASDHKIRIYSFNDCIEALQEFRPNFYDLIILDFMMPKINGFEFYDIVKILDDQVKFCFVTTTSKDVIKKAYRDVKTDRLLNVPVTKEELVKETEEILGP
jgi:two-component SAPR family response regulator